MPSTACPSQGLPFQPLARSIPAPSARRPAVVARSIGRVAILLIAGAACRGHEFPSSPFAQSGQGSLAITVTGLPANTDAGVSVTGPDGYLRNLTGSATLMNLPEGTYSVAATTVNTATARYVPSPSPQVAVVAAAAAPAPVIVEYDLSTGTLAVDLVTPQGITGSVTVSGPGFSQVLTASSTLTHLAPGAYSITAGVVTSGGDVYAPDPSAQSVTVPASTIAVPAAVTYTAVSPANLNLTIDALHITQSVQTYAGGVPLVAGRAGLLRVFARASQPNVAQPPVRVRFYQGGALVSTLQIAAPAATTPTTMAEGTLGASWNHVLPPGLLQPGISVIADVDPDNLVPETSESDNSWPHPGVAAALDVRVAPPLAVRFVPVLQSANGLVGSINDGNRDAFLAPTRAMFPLGQVDADIRSTYTTSAPPVQANNGNGAWSQILNEIRALRAADGSTRHYYGVVKATYGSGVAGVAYLGTAAAIGWDAPSTGPGVMAHELGHTFGRSHAPCGVSGGDPDYPYSGGAIGVHGYDLTTGKLWSPGAPDLMGYCSGVWISDYTYAGILAWRQQHAGGAAAVMGGAGPSSSASREREPGLLVWGRMRGDQLVLEPAYEIEAPPLLPARPGPDLIEGFGATGERLLTMSFEAEPVMDLPGEQTFAFVIPKRMLNDTPLARLRLVSQGREVERRSTAPEAIVDAAATVRTVRIDARTTRVTWPAAGVRGVLIRDAGTGDILAFGRDGSADVRSDGAELELLLSDGVRTLKRRSAPR